MTPAYSDHSINFVNRLSYIWHEPRRGDVVGIRLTPPDGWSAPHIMFLKRIIGLPGETISFVDGRAHVNGRPLDEPYEKGACDWNLAPVALGPEEVLRGWGQPLDAKRRTHLRQGGTKPDCGQGAAMKWPRPLRLALVAALGVCAWVVFHPSPERLIRKQLKGVTKAVSFGPNEGSLAKLAGAQRLADFFSTNVEVQINVPGRQEHRLAGREEIQQAALAARSSMQSLSVTFPDITIIVNADQQSAVADLTLQARIAGEPDMIVQEMKFTLRKIAGEWLIVKVETVRTLS